MSKSAVAAAFARLAEFDLFEQSVHQRAPINLYLFKYGGNDAAFKAYTDAALPITIEGITYQPETISRGVIAQKGNLDDPTFTISVPVDNDIAQLTNAGTPNEMLFVWIYEVHHGDPAMTPHQIGHGVCRSRQDGDDTTSVITVLPKIGRTNVNIVRRVVTRQCDLLLYSQGLRRCQVNPALYLTRPVVTAISSISLGVGPGWVLPGFTYMYGVVWWDGTDGIQHRHTITNFTATGIQLEALPKGLDIGTPIYALPNCRHNIFDCNRFANLDNYGGFPFIPTKTVVKDATSFT